MISIITAVFLMTGSSLFTAGVMYVIDREQLRMTRWTRDLALAMDQRATRYYEQVRRFYAAADTPEPALVIDEPTGELPIVQPRTNRIAQLIGRDRRDYQPRHRRGTAPANLPRLTAGVLPAVRRLA